jgi:hypothetical protein
MVPFSICRLPSCGYLFDSDEDKAADGQVSRVLPLRCPLCDSPMLYCCPVCSACIPQVPKELSRCCACCDRDLLALISGAPAASYGRTCAGGTGGRPVRQTHPPTGDSPGRALGKGTPAIRPRGTNWPATMGE